MVDVVITGLGLNKPAHVITNAELVASFNNYMRANPPADKPLEEAFSSEAFIEKASGIKQRYVVDKEGILDITRMRPRLAKRDVESTSIQCEFTLPAALEAIKKSGHAPQDIDLVIMSCTNHERAYPSMAVELQHLLGTTGRAFDMGVACSSATFGIEAAYNAIKAKTAKCVLVVNPEITCAHLNYKDRDSHFIFGDACTACVIESAETAKNPLYKICSTSCKTEYSTNIFNKQGFLASTLEPPLEKEELYFIQQGRKVFKEVIPWVTSHIENHLASLNMNSHSIHTYWLHQANANMNNLIAKKLLGENVTFAQAPIILDKYANTSSAGVMIALYEHSSLPKNGYGMLCSFGAGYSVGSVLLQSAIN